MKKYLLVLLSTVCLSACTIAAPLKPLTPSSGSDVIGNTSHYGIIGTDGVGVNFKGFIIVPAGVAYYNALIKSYGGLPQDTMGDGLMIGFTPALTSNYGISLRPDGNYDMTLEAEIKYFTMIDWATNGIKPQSWLKSVF